MKRLIAELAYEITAWLILILGSVILFLKWVAKGFVTLYKKKELIKNQIRESSEKEMDRLYEIEREKALLKKLENTYGTSRKKHSL